LTMGCEGVGLWAGTYLFINSWAGERSIGVIFSTEFAHIFPRQKDASWVVRGPDRGRPTTGGEGNGDGTRGRRVKDGVAKRGGEGPDLRRGRAGVMDERGGGER